MRFTEGQIQDALAVVGQQMASDYGIKVEWTDKNRVVADVENRKVYLPAMSCLSNFGVSPEKKHAADIVLHSTRANCMHEFGHCAFTTLCRSETPKGALFEILNALEDVRIERKVVETYPGYAEIFRWSTNHSRERIAGLVLDGENVRDLWLAMCGCIFQCQGFAPSWRWSGRAKEYFDVVYPTFMRVLVATDTKDCLRLAEEIYENLKQFLKEQKRRDSEDSDKGSSGDSDDSDEDTEDSDKGSDGDSEDSNKGSDKDSNEDTEDSDKDSDEDSDEDTEDSDDGSPGDSEDSDDSDEDSSGDSEDSDKDSDEDSDEDTEDSDKGSPGDSDDGSPGDSDGDSEDSEDSDEDTEDSDKDSDEDSDEDTEDSEDSDKGSDEDSDEDTEDSDKGSDGDSEDSDKGSDGDSDEDSEDSDDSDEDSDGDIESQLDHDAEGDSLTEQVNEELEKSLRQLKESGDDNYTSLRFNDNHRIPDSSHSDQDFIRLTTKLEAEVAVMTLYLEQMLRAITRCRKEQFLRSGRLDNDRLVEVAKGLSKNIFYQKHNGRKLDTAVSLVIDESGSMSAISDIRDLCIMLGECLFRIGVPFEIIGSTTKLTKFSTEDKIMPALNGFSRTNPIIYDHFKQFEEQWPIVRKRLTMMNSYNHNIDGEVLEFAAARIHGRPESRKIVFCLTDGEPEGGQDNDIALVKHVARVANTARACGIEVYGVGLATCSPEKYYGKENFIFLPSSEGCGQVFVRAFADIITNGAVRM